MLTQLKQTKSAIWKIALSLPVIALLTFMYSCESNESDQLEPTIQPSADVTEVDNLDAYKSKYPDIAIDRVDVIKKTDGESTVKITVKNVDNLVDKRNIEEQLSKSAMQRIKASPKETNSNALQEVPLQDAREVFQIVEQQPVPVGGLNSLYEYIGKNLVYSAEARTKGIEGRVFVQFIVNKDGSISDVQVLKGLGHGLDAEALRVVKNMPAWQPGKQKGQPVNVRMSLPIVFKLN